jgi:radical SAM protein with 4Fe4S-binding SPASM domain
LRKDWEAIANEVGEVGLHLLLITNGWSVNNDTVSQLAELPHLRRIGVSLDSAQPEIHDKIRGRQGSHARALRSLFNLRDAGLEVGAITTILKTNIEQLEPLRDLLAGENITWQIQIANSGGARFHSIDQLNEQDFYRVGHFISESRRTYSINELPLAGSHDLGYHSEVLGPVSELPEWQGCGAGLYTLGIMSDGRIKGCLSQHDDFIEDNLRHRSLVDIWHDPNLFIRNRHFSPELLEGFCGECPHGMTCRAGCSNMGYTATGRLFDNPYCFYRIEHEGIQRDRSFA